MPTATCEQLLMPLQAGSVDSRPERLSTEYIDARGLSRARGFVWCSENGSPYYTLGGEGTAVITRRSCLRGARRVLQREAALVVQITTEGLQIEFKQFHPNIGVGLMAAVSVS